MYHGTPHDRPSSIYSINCLLFIKHLQYIRKSGWTTLLFNELSHPNKIQEKNIVLTFDDGYANNYNNAFKALLEYNMKATWFISTDYIGQHAFWLPPPTEHTRMLSRKQIADMHHSGMEIASHTCSHPDLTKLTLDQQLKELTQSKKILEEIINSPVTTLAYPFGRYNNNSLTAAHRTGYHLACTTNSGWFSYEENPLLARRITIFSNDNVSMLARKLAFADNDISWKKLTDYYRRRLLNKLRN